MPIVAVSMPDSDLESLELLRDEGGFSSRSEVVRYALRSLLSLHKALEDLEGAITAVVTVTYSGESKHSGAHDVQHRYAHLLSAVMHSHSHDGCCIDVLLLSGDAEDMREFVKAQRSQRQVLRVDVNIVGR